MKYLIPQLIDLELRSLKIIECNTSSVNLILLTRILGNWTCGVLAGNITGLLNPVELKLTYYVMDEDIADD